MTTFSGIFIPTHKTCDAASKEYAAKTLTNWQVDSCTPADWIAKLELGQTISLSTFTPQPDGTYTHGLDYWQSTCFIFADGDNIIGVEQNTDGSEKNDKGVELWTEPDGLSKRYPTLSKKVYTVGQSVSSMSLDKPPVHRRYRLGFRTDMPIETEEHYHQILLALAEEFPIIPYVERSPAQPVFGNAREGFSFHTCGNILKLSDYPYRKPEPKSKPKPKPTQTITRTLREWLDFHKIKYEEKAYKGTEKFIVDCPHDNSHTTDAWITDEGGAWQFSCSHNSCKGDRSTWKAYKSALGIEDKNPARPKRDNPLPKLKDGSDYFVHDDFNVLAMSEYIQSQFTIWAQDAGIFIYDKGKGVYVLGELEIDQAVRKELGILRKKRFTDEVLADLRACCRKPNLPDNSHLIGFRNGVLELTFGKDQVLQWKAHSPDNYLTTVFPVDFNLNAPVTEGSADFEEWLTEVLDGDTELVKVCYEAIGSIFHKGSVDMQRGLLLVGEGGTGKSMFLIANTKADRT